MTENIDQRSELAGIIERDREASGSVAQAERDRRMLLATVRRLWQALEDIGGMAVCAGNMSLTHDEAIGMLQTTASITEGTLSLTRPATNRLGHARRVFANEYGHEISIFVEAGPPGKNVSSRVMIRGPRSLIESNMTSDELESLRDAILEALT